MTDSAKQNEHKGATIVARAAHIAAESGAPVEQVTAALTQTTDLWRRYTELVAVIEQARHPLSYAATALEASADNGDRYCAEQLRDIQSALADLTV